MGKIHLENIHYEYDKLKVYSILYCIKNVTQLSEINSEVDDQSRFTKYLINFPKDLLRSIIEMS